MKSKVKLLFVLILSPLLVSAQMSGKGQIISVEGDTLKCFIHIEQREFCEVVKYRSKIEDRFKKFPLANVYRIIMKGKTFEKIILKKEDVQGGTVYAYRLCICVVDGFMKLYKESITMFYHGADGISKTKDGKLLRSDTYYIIKGIGYAEEVNSKFFAKQSQKTFIDYKYIAQSIKEKKYSYDDIKTIVENCNEIYYSDLLEGN